MNRGKSCKYAAGVTMIIFAFLLMNVAGATPDVLYVASQDGNSISIADTDINKVMATVTVPSPISMAVGADNLKLFTADKAGNMIYVIYTTESIAEQYLGSVSPDDMVSSVDGTEVFIASATDGRVTAIYTNGSNQDVMSVDVDGVNVLAASPDGSKLFAASTSNNTISVIDLATDEVTAVTGILAPDSLAAGPDGSSVYVASSTNSTVSLIQPETGAISSVIDVTSPKGLGLLPDGSKLYVAGYDSGNVSVIDTSSITIVATIPVGSGPCSVTISTDGTKAYVANSGSSTVSVIDTSSDVVSNTIAMTSVPSEVLIAAAPSDVPFRLRVNSYWFPNFYGSEFSTTDFTNTYGYYDLSDPDTKVSRFYNDFFRYSATNGTCFGMTSSSLPLYNQRLGIWGYNEVDPVPDNWTWAVEIPASYPVATVGDWVEYYQPLQYDKACVADLATYNNLPDNYAELKQRLSSDWRTAPMLIGFSCEVWDSVSEQWVPSGHTLVPYEIQESADGKSANILVWDPNHPYGALNGTDAYRYLTVDLEHWTVADYDGRRNVTNVQLISLSAINAPPELPDDVISLTGEFSASHLLFTGDTGGYLGDLKGISLNSISGACPIVTYGALGSGSVIEAYYVPSALGVKKELIGDSDGMSTVSIYEPNGLIMIDTSVSQGSVGQFEVLDGGTGVQYVSQSSTSTLSLTVSVEGSDSAQIVSVDTQTFEPGESLSLSDTDGVMEIVNVGQPRTCVLYLRQAGTDSNTVEGVVVEVEADTTVIATPVSWSDISQGVIVEHDVGSDGTIDSTDTYDPSAVLEINDFSADVVSGAAPLTVELTADVTGGADKYQWKFGPSSTEISDINIVSHTFKKPGVYPVSLSIKDMDGHIRDEMTKEDYIVVT